jgi:histidine triad (HIT) family protein|tara:strand:+ start:460 stop:852 length:393 start_codon:yes stop_codon:yes gene_type:complete
MPSIFTKIINGEIPSYKIAENEACVAFLDVFPLQKGHTLIVPKKEVDKLFDLDDSSYSKLFSFSKYVAKAIEKAFPCNRVGVAVIGLEVPHAHIHLIPINHMDDMNFANNKLKLQPQEFIDIAEAIKKEI